VKGSVVMEGVKYSLSDCYTKKIIRLDDPVFRRPWYLKSISRSGEYDWTLDPLYARQFTLHTAQKHLAALESGADKDWEWYRNHWKEYLESIRKNKMEVNNHDEL